MAVRFKRYYSNEFCTQNLYTSLNRVFFISFLSHSTIINSEILYIYIYILNSTSQLLDFSPVGFGDVFFPYSGTEAQVPRPTYSPAQVLGKTSHELHEFLKTLLGSTKVTTTFFIKKEGKKILLPSASFQPPL